MTKQIETTTPATPDAASLEALDGTQLDQINGGGLLGHVLKIGEKVAPLARRAGPALLSKARHAAAWTGIPAAGGAAAAWVEHRFDHK